MISRRLQSCMLTTVFGCLMMCSTSIQADVVRKHVPLDGELRVAPTFLGLVYSTHRRIHIEACQYVWVGMEKTGWGFDELTIYRPDPDVFSWSSSKQVAVYDPISVQSEENMGSIHEFLVENDYFNIVHPLQVPAFGPVDYNSATGPNLYTAIDLAAWVAGVGDYIWLGDYSFAGGVNPSLPGITVATEPFTWDGSVAGGWTVDNQYLYSGEAKVVLEEGFVVPSPVASIAGIVLFGALAVARCRRPTRAIRSLE